MKYLLEITAFISGAVVMIVELDGSRIIAPYLGTSTIVWTGLIGVILGSLSIGYWWGGKLADRDARFEKLGGILALSALSVLYITYMKNILAFSLYTPNNLILATLIGTTILFAPATILLGMVSPYLARLKMRSVETSGSTIGALYAISTLGSIIGTFLGGFFLISYLGSTTILLYLSAVLFILASGSLWHSDIKQKKARVLLCIIMALVVVNLTPPQSFGMARISDVDTEYSRVWIYDAPDRETGRPARYLTNSIYVVQSGMFLDAPDELLFSYSKFFTLAPTLYPDFKNVLMIGAGAYSYPKYFMSTYPDAQLTVVEIDPTLKVLAEKYFDFKPNEKLTLIDEDGRTFLNDTKQKFNLILNDAFLSQYNIPFQLTTKEAIQKMYDALDEKGVVMLNIISGISGPTSEFLSAEYATYKEVFPKVFLVQVENKQKNAPQNVMLFAFKAKDGTLPLSVLKNTFNMSDEQIITPSITSDTLILTDEFAPIEKYMIKMLR
ncbi:MAG: fused MFS/spermidine synthase [Candidatus Taylorbacteria bacterium]|nr:fused MFS/spermidine synthase [Candidatus Taylorbacteria bacterium]